MNAAIQRVGTIKPTVKRSNISHAGSRGAIIQQIEKAIANLDQWQKRAAIETPDGPQRIRGLAGSGKTIVLALKAAYLHTAFPDWDIVVTFNTRALYQQFRDLVRRFCFDAIEDEPNSVQTANYACSGKPTPSWSVCRNRSRQRSAGPGFHICKTYLLLRDCVRGSMRRVACLLQEGNSERATRSARDDAASRNVGRSDRAAAGEKTAVPGLLLRVGHPESRMRFA